MVGNRAVISSITVQREPPDVRAAPHTSTWAETDSSKDRARLSRTTKIEADRWGETGPAPPRISYDRTAELWTQDGVSAYVRIDFTVYLDPKAPLPTGPEEALRTVGRAARGTWSFHAEGGDLETAIDSRTFEIARSTSLRSLSTDFPDYARLPLSAKEQEAAILRHLATLPRRPRKQTGNDTDYVGKGIDLVTDFVPGLSNLKDVAIFITGVNPFTGEKVGPLGRLMSLVMAIPGLGTLLKYVGRGVAFIVRRVLDPLIRVAIRGGQAMVRWIARTRFAALVGRVVEGAGRTAGRLKERLLRRLGVQNVADRLIGRGTRWQGNFPHTASPNAVLYRADASGKVTYYQVYGADGLPLKRVDINPASAVHGGVPPPHVVEFQRNTNPTTGVTYARQNRMVRPARPDEVPRIK
jgi:hypothetical protein